MLPFALLALGAIAAANEFSTDRQVEREIERFREGKQDLNTTRSNVEKINIHYMDLMDGLAGETESSIERQQITWQKQFANNSRMTQEKYEKMSSREKELFHREQAICARNSGAINDQQLDKYLEDIRNNFR